MSRERWGKREGRLAENGGYSEQGEVGQKRKGDRQKIGDTVNRES